MRNVENNKRIGLVGIAGSGKDFIVNEVIKRFPEYERISFSDQLKKLTHKCFEYVNLDYAPELKEKPLNFVTSLNETISLSPREIWLKMNFLREIENKVFIRHLADELKTLEYMNVECFIISDIRTLEELKFAKNKGFKIIRIHNDNPAHKLNDFDRQQFSKEFNELIDKTYINTIGKPFNENEFFF